MTLKQHLHKANVDGSFTYSDDEVPLHPCTEDDLEQMYPLNDSQQRYPSGGYYCPDRLL